MLGVNPRAARATWSAAVVILLLAAIYAIRQTLLVFVIALLFAYMLFPLVDYFSRKLSSWLSTRKRGPAIAITYLLVIGIAGLMATLIISKVVAEVRHMAEKPPDVQGYLDHLSDGHPSLAPYIDSVRDRVREQLGRVAAEAPKISLKIFTASADLIFLIIIPVLSFFMLKDGRKIRASFLELFDAQRNELEGLLDDIHKMLLSYVRSLLWLCAATFVVFSIVLASLGVPYALLLASIAFLCEFIPLLGPITAAVIIIAVSAVNGYDHLLVLLGYLGLYRLFQDYVLQPRLMSEGVELHPMLVMFGVFAGGDIAGVPGIFLSVPVLAMARLLFYRFRPGATRVALPG